MFFGIAGSINRVHHSFQAIAGHTIEAPTGSLCTGTRVPLSPVSRHTNSRTETPLITGTVSVDHPAFSPNLFSFYRPKNKAKKH